MKGPLEGLRQCKKPVYSSCSCISFDELRKSKKASKEKEKMKRRRKEEESPERDSDSQ